MKGCSAELTGSSSGELEGAGFVKMEEDGSGSWRGGEVCTRWWEVGGIDTVMPPQALGD